MRAASSEGRLFLTVGTSLDPFDRLLRMVDSLCSSGRLRLRVIAQSGCSTYRPSGFTTTPFFPEREFMEHLRGADVVVCHAGAGTLGTCLQLGKRPVVVPRRASHREIVNDHQLELCRALASEGRIFVAEDAEELFSAIERALVAGPPPEGEGGRRLRQEIGELLRRLASRHHPS